MGYLVDHGWFYVRHLGELLDSRVDFLVQKKYTEVYRLPPLPPTPPAFDDLMHGWVGA